MTLDIDQIRSQIPTVDKMTYLNTGWSGPSPTYVVEAIEERLRYTLKDQKHEIINIFILDLEVNLRRSR